MNRLTEEKQIGPWASLKNKAEAKIGAFNDYDCLMAHMEAVTRLKYYEDLEAQGRLVVLPFLPGEKVLDYSEYFDGTPYPEHYVLCDSFIGVGVSNDGKRTLEYDCVTIDHEQIGENHVFKRRRGCNCSAEAFLGKRGGRMSATISRETILDTAKNCVCGDREQDYGNPEDNFQTIANLWIDYLSVKKEPLDIEPKDVAAMLALLKIARIASGHAKADNWIDLAGYAACGGEIEGNREAEE